MVFCFSFIKLWFTLFTIPPIFFEFSSYYSLLYCTYEQNDFYEFKEML